MNDIYFGKVLFSSPLLVSLGSQDRNIDHKWRVFQGYDISPKRITVWLTHHISLESPVFYRISIFISIQFLLQSIKPSVATCEARIMEEKTWNRLKVGIENRMLITLGPGSLDINLLFLAAVVFISRPLQDSSGRISSSLSRYYRPALRSSTRLGHSLLRSFPRLIPARGRP